VKSAFSAAIQANLTAGASRRRPRLFLGWRAPSAARNSLAQPRELTTLRRDELGPAVRGIGTGALDRGGTSGFNAVLGGNRSIDGKYDRLEAHGIYWTISENDPTTTPLYNFG